MKTTPAATDRSKVVACDSFRWEGVGIREYKQGDEHFKDITKQVLLGESDGERALRFVTRYFEIQPGGYSSLERHEHPHAVIVIRGRGNVLLGRTVRPVEPFDSVYVSPGDFHQFRTVGDEPLGFICIVDRERDRPTLATADDVAMLSQDPVVREFLDPRHAGRTSTA